MNDDALIWASYGRQASLDGDQATAIEAFEHALELGAGDSAEVWIALGVALGQARRTEPAIDAFEKAVALDPKALDAWCMLGECALELERYALALAAFTRCHELDPGAEKPHGARAKALIRKTSKKLINSANP